MKFILIFTLLLAKLATLRAADTTPPPAARGLSVLSEWSASKDTRLSFQDNELRIESVGRDPSCFTRELPVAKGPFVLELTMKSTAKGEGQIFFTTAPKDGFYRETIRVKEQFPEQFRILAEMDPAKLGGKPVAFELYDLQADRDEMHNLARDPAHRPELERLFAALKQWSADTHDTTAPLPPLPENPSK